MKKKLLIALLATVSAVCTAFAFTACDNGNGNDKADGWGSVYTFETAYAAAKELGYGGTLEEFIESIKGKDGADGKDGLDGTNGVDGKDGVDGTNGVDGKDGTDGKDGVDGVGVKNAFINESGELIIELTNDSTVNCGIVSAYNESLQYVAIKEDNEVVGYTVKGIGTVSETDLVIPSTYRGKPVKSIGKNAFLNYEELTSVTLSDGVTSIESGAFSGCSGLTGITIPDSVTSIGSSAFAGCENLNLIYLGGLEDWCNISMSVNTNLNVQKFYLNDELISDLIIPETVNEIKDFTFSGFIGLTSLTISEGVTTIGNAAFRNCFNLNSVNIRDGVTTIGNAAFGSCFSLTSVDIPDSVTTIDNSAFSSCIKLETVKMPTWAIDSVTGAFQYLIKTQT